MCVKHILTKLIIRN